MYAFAGQRFWTPVLTTASHHFRRKSLSAESPFFVFDPVVKSPRGAQRHRASALRRSTVPFTPNTVTVASVADHQGFSNFLRVRINMEVLAFQHIGETFLIPGPPCVRLPTSPGFFGSGRGNSKT